MESPDQDDGNAVPADTLAAMGERINRGAVALVADPDAQVSDDADIGHHEHESVRAFEHHGRQIEIHTSYRIVVDDVDVPVTYQVLENGAVHHHGLPQYATGSAVELTKRLVDELLVDDPQSGSAGRNGGGC